MRLHPQPETDLVAVVGAALVEHRGALQRYLRLRLSVDDANEMLQRSSQRALERAHTLRDPTRVRAWLFAVLRSELQELYRTRFRERLRCDDVAVAELQAPLEHERCHCSVKQLEQLNPSLREVVQLVDLDELSPDETARRLGITTNNLYVRLHRGRQALRQQLESHCGLRDAGSCNDCLCVERGCCD